MFVRINDINMYYEIQGIGDPIILVHGSGEDHKIFNVLVRDLSKTNKVYSIDSRCHGKSSMSDKLSYETMASDMVKFIKKLNINKPIFYGFSDGGIIGLMVAMKEPHLLKKLIISGANLNPEGLKEKVLAKVKKVANKGNRLYKLMATEPNIKPEELHTIEIPTVVLAGENDLIRQEHTELIAENIKDSTLNFIPKEDHSSYIVHSKKLYPILKKYL